MLIIEDSELAKLVKPVEIPTIHCTPPQKVKSARALSLIHYPIKDEKDIDVFVCGKTNYSAGFNASMWDSREVLFVRCAPLTPRPGFVDSRILLKSDPELKEKLLAILNESRQADPQSWLFIQPYSFAHGSAVLSGNHLTIGRWNDGATSGKHILFNNGFLHCSIKSYTLKLADITGEPQLEYIIPGGVVQIRNGADAKGIEDHVPKRTRVLSVVEPSGDFLAWEKEVATLAPGTAVFTPSLTNHYAQHVLLNRPDLPIITSHRPQVGELLKKESASRLDSLDLSSAREGFNVARNVSLNRDLIYLVFAGIHGAPYLYGRDGSFLIGLCCGLLWRFGLLALGGEYRHLFPKAGTEFLPGLKNPLGRDAVYRLMEDNPELYRRDVPKMIDGFRKIQTGASVGGERWALCGLSWMELDRNLSQMMKDDKFQLKSLLSAANRVLDLAHNNGLWLNKFGNIEDGLDYDKMGIAIRHLHAILTARSVLNSPTNCFEQDLIDDIYKVQKANVDICTGYGILYRTALKNTDLVAFHATGYTGGGSRSDWCGFYLIDSGVGELLRQAQLQTRIITSDKGVEAAIGGELFRLYPSDKTARSMFTIPRKTKIGKGRIQKLIVGGFLHENPRTV